MRHPKDRFKAANRPGPLSPPSLPFATGKLEEQVEFTNLTKFRSSLLAMIPRLQGNEYLRFVVTKHGQPAAVIMSYEAYQLLKRSAEKLVEQDNAMDADQALREDYQELTGTPIEPVLLQDEARLHVGELQTLQRNLEKVIQTTVADTLRGVLKAGSSEAVKDSIDIIKSTT